MSWELAARELRLGVTVNGMRRNEEEWGDLPQYRKVKGALIFVLLSWLRLLGRDRDSVLIGMGYQETYGSVRVVIIHKKGQSSWKVTNWLWMRVEIRWTDLSFD